VRRSLLRREERSIVRLHRSFLFAQKSAEAWKQAGNKNSRSGVLSARTQTPQRPTKMGELGEMPERFEQLVLPHLDAAYNLARWLVGSPTDAQDIVQEAFLRALRFFGGFRGGDSRAWLLKIVRNTSYSWVRKNRPAQLADEFDETKHSDETATDNAETKLLSRAESERVRKALEALPLTFREVLVLREIEGLSYKEISEVTGVAMGTVMSSLSRARQKLRDQLGTAAEREI
jgi:RNA polymerase sigma-70 factor (ECF subfamily)